MHCRGNKGTGTCARLGCSVTRLSMEVDGASSGCKAVRFASVAILPVLWGLV